MLEPRIRLARLDEIPALQDVERRAVVRFVEAGYPDIARLPVVDTATHTAAITADRLFVIHAGDNGRTRRERASPRHASNRFSK